MSHVIYFVNAVEYVYIFFYFLRQKLVCQFFILSVIEVKQVVLRRVCPWGHSRPQEAQWVYGKLTSICMPGNIKNILRSVCELSPDLHYEMKCK